MLRDKNDLMALSFDQIKPRVEQKIAAMKEVLLNDINNAINARNNRKVKEVLDLLPPDASESNFEGLEESVRESIALDEPITELTLEQNRKIEKDARTYVVGTFINHYNLGSKHSWVLPQMIAMFGTWKAVRDEETGLYSPFKTFKVNTEDPFNYGLWAVSMQPRSDLIVTEKSEPQYKLKSYNSLVPLILAGFKQFQNIEYSKWPRDNSIAYLVNEELGKAMLSTLPILTVEEIMELRTVAQTPKTGNRAGKQGSPITTAAMFHLADFTKCDVTNIPKLALHMLCQTWLAHPANRSPRVQILDPENWDNVPAPLIGNTVVSNKPEYDWGSTKKAGIYDTPW